MYFDKDPDHNSDRENERILRMINQSPVKGSETDPEVRAAFEESIRNLAEEILEYNPALAHVLLGMSGDEDPFESLHGQN